MQWYLSEKGLVQQGNVFFKVFLGFFIDPLFEVSHVKRVCVLVLFLREPVHERGEMFFDLFPVENSVDHVAAKESHFDFVSRMGVYFFVFVDDFEYVRCSWSVGEFEVVEGFFGDGQFVAFVEVFDGNFVNYRSDFIVSVLEEYLGFHDFLI